MSGSNSNRVRLIGKLIKGERGYVLQCEDESVWRLEFQDGEQGPELGDVTVEGVQSGRETVKVDWIGAIAAD